MLIAKTKQKNWLHYQIQILLILSLKFHTMFAQESELFFSISWEKEDKHVDTIHCINHASFSMK